MRVFLIISHYFLYFLTYKYDLSGMSKHNNVLFYLKNKSRKTERIVIEMMSINVRTTMSIDGSKEFE